MHETKDGCGLPGARASLNRGKGRWRDSAEDLRDSNSRTRRASSRADADTRAMCRHSRSEASGTAWHGETAFAQGFCFTASLAPVPEEEQSERDLVAQVTSRHHITQANGLDSWNGGESSERAGMRQNQKSPKSPKSGPRHSLGHPPKRGALALKEPQGFARAGPAIGPRPSGRSGSRPIGSTRPTRPRCWRPKNMLKAAH